MAIISHKLQKLTTATLQFPDERKFGYKVANLIFIFVALFYAYTLIKGQVGLIFNPKITLSQDSTKIKLFEYIGQKTPKDSLFLTPPQFADMRMIPKRAIVIDLKIFPFREDHMDEWYRRVSDLYGSKPDPNFDANAEKDYKGISDEKIMALFDKYKFNYVVLDISTKTKLNIIYSDEFFKLAKITIN